VSESITTPTKCYRHNLVSTLNLVDATREASTAKFIFLSTTALPTD
jgi:UDP-glucose 4-epimerase